jgi:hypothetical protein
MKREPALLFYPKFAWDSARKAWSYWRGFRWQKQVLKRVLNDPARWDYEDLAIRPLAANELAALDLFHETAGGEAAVAKARRQEAMIKAVHAAHQAAE